MQFNALIPELYVSNFEKSLEFYLNILEFTLEYQREEPKFAFLSYQKCQLMIQQEDDDKDWHNAKPDYPFGIGLNFQIQTQDAQHVIDNLTKFHYPLKRGLQDSYYQVNDESYGFREFLVMDIDGYLLRFSQPV